MGHAGAGFPNRGPRRVVEARALIPRKASNYLLCCPYDTPTSRDRSRFFSSLASSKYCLLNTYKRDGTRIATPVNVVVDGDVAYFRTWSTSGKAKRLRYTPRVELRASGPRGKPRGDAKLSAEATLLSGDESQTAAAAIAHQHPFLHGLVVRRLTVSGGGPPSGTDWSRLPWESLAAPPDGRERHRADPGPAG